MRTVNKMMKYSKLGASLLQHEAGDSGYIKEGHAPFGRKGDKQLSSETLSELLDKDLSRDLENNGEI